MKKCTFCESTNVVLSSGYNYCQKCAGRLDRTQIISDIAQHFASLTTQRIDQFCREMFGTDDYRYAAFKRLYPLNPRGEWIESERRFVKSHSDYLIETFSIFLKQKYPKVWEKIDECQ